MHRACDAAIPYGSLIQIRDLPEDVDFLLGQGVAGAVAELLVAERELAAPDIAVFETLAVLFSWPEPWPCRWDFGDLDIHTLTESPKSSLSPRRHSRQLHRGCMRRPANRSGRPLAGPGLLSRTRRGLAGWPGAALRC